MSNLKKNRVITWPTTSYFTFKDLYSINPQFDKEITLRVRLAKEVESGKVAEIGAIPGGLRRPPKVYALTPVSQITLDKADANGVSINYDVNSAVNTIPINPKSSNFVLSGIRPNVNV